jgi:hypothetical protein
MTREDAAKLELARAYARAAVGQLIADELNAARHAGARDSTSPAETVSAVEAALAANGNTK